MCRLWCAGKLEVQGMGKCCETSHRIKFSCLSCRLRRFYIGKYKPPQVYYKYVFKSIQQTYLVKEYKNGDGTFVAPDGKFLRVTRLYHVLVDSSRFLHVRLCIIMLIDQFIYWYKTNLHLQSNKPWVEFAEYLANYP